MLIVLKAKQGNVDSSINTFFPLVIRFVETLTVWFTVDRIDA